MIFFVCMNINKKITSESEFNIHYATIYRELSKIANNMLCNAIPAYNSIFSIAISQNGFEEKLYWDIGDFMYVCAKERRIRIFASDEWFESYCTEFERYSVLVESVNAICTFLNDVLVKNEKGRRMDDFGYLLWDRCVLQNVEPNKKISLCDELLKRIETPTLNYKKALQSLKKIIPDPAYPLYFYEHYYEEKALAYIKDVYSRQLTFEDFEEYINQIEEIFVFESQRMNLIFLDVSHQKVIGILEDICIKYHQSYIYNCIYAFLPSNTMLLQSIFKRIGIYSIQFRNVVKEAIRKYIKIVVLKDISSMHTLNRDDFVFFKMLNNIYLKTEELIKLYFDDEKLADDLFKKKPDELSNKTYNERLISFFDKIMIKESYIEMISIFTTCLRFVKSFESFGLLYHEALKKRLLSYRYTFNREKDNLECLRTYLDVVTYKKCVKMIKDVNWSIIFNRLLTPFLESDMKQFDNSQLSYFTSILNLCAWPLDCDYDKDIKLGEQQQAYVTALESYFTSRYPDRRLIWLWEDSIVYMELETDKVYTLKMNVLDSTVFLCFAEYDKLSLGDIQDLTKIRQSDLDRILGNFVKLQLVIENDHNYMLNAHFYSSKAKIYVGRVESIQEIAPFDYCQYYKDIIIKKLTKCSQMEKTQLEGSIIFEHCDAQPFNKAAYDVSIKELTLNGKIIATDNMFMKL